MEELEKNLRESLAYFEQILDVMPDDRMALEFLCVACQQLGDNEKFLKYALALADVTLREKNVESAAELIEKLKDSADARAQAAVLKLQVLIAPEPELKFEKPEDRMTSATSAVAAKAELELLNKLVAEGVLSRTLVQSAFDQLENLPSAEGDFLISALSILEKENLTGAADALAAVADAAHAPPIPVDAFELVPAQVRQVDERLLKVRGVVPFAKLGNEWAVAVLNPLDETLKREVAAALGAKCHFFLAVPSAMEKALDRFFKGDGNIAPTVAAAAPVAAVPASAPAAAAAAATPAPSSTRPKLGIRRPKA